MSSDTVFWLKAMSNCILKKHVQIPLSSLVSISHVNSGIIFCICGWLLEEMIFSRIYLLIIISKVVYWVDPNVMRIFDTWILYLYFRLMYICQLSTLSSVKSLLAIIALSLHMARLVQAKHLLWRERSQMMWLCHGML
jgi:hypothetical protein